MRVVSDAASMRRSGTSARPSRVFFAFAAALFASTPCLIVAIQASVELAVGGQQLLDLGSQGADLVEVGALAGAPARVAVGAEELVELLQRRQGVGLLGGVGQRDRGHEVHLRVMGEKHVDRLHERHLVS